MDQETLPQVLSAKALAGIVNSSGKTKGARTEIKACHKTIDLADDKAPLNSATGKRWVGKVKGWAEAAYKSIESAIAADDVAKAAIEAKDYAAGQKANASAAALLASAADQAGRARDWCNMMLQQRVVNNSAYAKKLVVTSRDHALKAINLANEARTGNLEAAEKLAQLLAGPEEPVEPPVEPVIPPETLSTLEIRALADNANEDAGEDIVFVIGRTGPLELPCSVTWNASGTAAADDFVVGTDFTGTRTWEAGEPNEQRLEFVLNPDNKMEPTETLVVTLSEPVDAKLGAASATVGIIDNDQAVPVALKAYDQLLPYGGMMLGAAAQDGGPGNQYIRNQSGQRQNALVMYLESDLPILAMQTENRVDHFPLGSTAGGYSDHTIVKSGGTTRRAMKGDNTSNVSIVQRPTGGDIRWRVAKLVSPENSTGFELEQDGQGNTKWAGQTALIKNCARDASWDDEWHKCGGTGSAPPRFGATYNGGSYPTIWFEQPIDPKKLGWKVGDRLAFCVTNSADPDSGPRGPHDGNLAPGYGKSQYSSVNMCYRTQRPLGKTTYPLMRYCGAWWKAYRYDGRYIPMLFVGHDTGDGKSMLVKGNGYCGLSGAGQTIKFGGQVSLRQIIRIPDDARWAGRKIIGCDGSLWRNSSSTSGSLTMSIARAGKNIGAADDQGKQIGSRTFSAADILQGDSKNYSGASDPHRNLKLAEPVEVLPGEAYYITLKPGAGSAASQFAIGRMLNFLGRAPKGLMQADHQNDKDKYQLRNGDGAWQTNTQYGGGDNYLHLGVALFFGL